MAPRDEGIDRELLDRVAVVARMRGESVEDVIERALRTYLEPPVEASGDSE